MNLAAFIASITADTPPAGLSPPLLALWHTARSEWARAHQIVQRGEGDPRHDWVHAHLHRVEGDLDNASYWYRRAGKTMPRTDLAAERDAIVAALLGER